MPMSMLVIFRVIFSIKITFFQVITIAVLYEIDVRLKLSKVQINKLTNKPINVITEKGKRSMLCITCCLFGELDGTFGTFLRGLLEAIGGQASSLWQGKTSMLLGWDHCALKAAV